QPDELRHDRTPPSGGWRATRSHHTAGRGAHQAAARPAAGATGDSYRLRLLAFVLGFRRRGTPASPGWGRGKGASPTEATPHQPEQESGGLAGGLRTRPYLAEGALPGRGDPVAARQGARAKDR